MFGQRVALYRSGMSAGTTLTRDELYRRIWSTPVSQLAKGFGISDVALAKICRKLDVPRPPRGYWQQLEHGQRPAKARLPRARAGTRTEFFIEHREPRPPRIEEPREPPPEVAIAENLRGAHRAARALNAELDRRSPSADGMFYIRASSESCVRISPALRRRALLVLDALARALEARGHSVTFEGGDKTKLWERCRIHAKVFEESISLRLFEPLLQTKLTAEQVAEKRKRGWYYDRDYVLTPSGKLVVRAEGDYAIGAKWSDGNGRMVEEQLGKAVLAIEHIVQRVRERATENARREEQWKWEAKRRDAQIAEEHYREALFRDLESMAEDWQRARRVLEFLSDLRARVPEERRSSGLTRWLEWAVSEAEALDPITEPSAVPKVLEPDFLRMADDEFVGWKNWDPNGGAEPIPSDATPEAEDGDNEDDGSGDPEGDSNLWGA